MDSFFVCFFLKLNYSMFFPPSSIIRSVGRAGAECAGSVDVIAAHSKMAPKVTLFIQIVRSRPQPAWACREHRLTLRALKVADSGFFFSSSSGNSHRHIFTANTTRMNLFLFSQCPVWKRSAKELGVKRRRHIAFDKSIQDNEKQKAPCSLM